MKIKADIESAISNINYYKDIIKKKISEQQDNDFKAGVQNTSHYDLLGTIHANADRIETFTEGINSCLKSIEVIENSPE
jgi:hypothetical protein